MATFKLWVGSKRKWCRAFVCRCISATVLKWEKVTIQVSVTADFTQILNEMWWDYYWRTPITAWAHTRQLRRTPFAKSADGVDVPQFQRTTSLQPSIGKMSGGPADVALHPFSSLSPHLTQQTLRRLFTQPNWCNLLKALPTVLRSQHHTLQTGNKEIVLEVWSMYWLSCKFIQWPKLHHWRQCHTLSRIIKSFFLTAAPSVVANLAIFVVCFRIKLWWAPLEGKFSNNFREVICKWGGGVCWKVVWGEV